MRNLYSITIWKCLFFYKLTFRGSKRYAQVSDLERKNLLILAVKEQIPPPYFFYFNLSKNWNKRQHYLYHSTIYHLFKNLHSHKTASILNDKKRFYEFCLIHQFPTPIVYGLADKAGLHLIQKKYPWELPQKDFIIKPINGAKGNGFVRFLYQPKKNAFYSSKEQHSIPAEMMEDYIKYLAKHSAKTLLIQEKLENHDSLVDYGNDALITIRILSILDQQNHPQLFRPIIKIPQNEQVLSYFHTGAHTYRVELETGIIKESLNTWQQFPPLLEQVPYWQAIKAYCQDMHSHLLDLPLIGWDVAVTPIGPIFLEGNVQPSLDIHQKEPFTPFIGTLFYQLFISHLK